MVVCSELDDILASVKLARERIKEEIYPGARPELDNIEAIVRRVKETLGCR
jgi:hypothetical protein